MGVAVWLFWEFFHARWKILFLHGGDRWGGREMRIVMQGEKYLCKVTLQVVEETLGHARWTRDEIWKVIWRASYVRTLVWWRGHLAMQDGCKVRHASHMHLTWELWCGRGDTWPCKMDMNEIWKVISCAFHMHLVWELWCGGGDHTRWMWGEIWKVISHASRMRHIQIDVTSLMFQGQMMNICKISPYILFKSHLTCTSDKKYPNRCYLFNVPRPNDEDLQDFSLYTFQMSSRMVTRWHLKSHLASTSCENFGVLGHARWTQGEIWKVISHVHRMRTLLLDVTSLMFQDQMMKICKIFSLYTFQMSSHMDTRWHLKSQLVSTSRENFGVLGHARWTWGEI